MTVLMTPPFVALFFEVVDLADLIEAVELWVVLALFSFSYINAFVRTVEAAGWGFSGPLSMPGLFSASLAIFLLAFYLAKATGRTSL